MPAIFGNQHGSDQGFDRQSGFDQAKENDHE
jgi:hypothetical protein